MRVSPNPSAETFAFQYSWENAESIPVLEVRNLLGQIVYTEALQAKTGLTTFGENLNKGVYLATLRSSKHSSEPVKLVKQ